jgi:hypothetical protein
VYGRRSMKHSRMRRLALLLAFGPLAWPSTAAGEQGAIVNPQLLALPLGQATRAQLYVLPRSSTGGDHPRSGCGLGAGGDTAPAERQARTALHRRAARPAHALGRVDKGASSNRLAAVSVRAGGHVYPDLIDGSRRCSSATTPRLSRQSACCRHLACWPRKTSPWMHQTSTWMVRRSGRPTYVLVEAGPLESWSLLERAECDLAVSFDHPLLPGWPASRVVAVPLFDDPVLVILPAAHPLASASELPLNRLSGETWILSKLCQREMLARLCTRGICPQGRLGHRRLPARCAPSGRQRVGRRAHHRVLEPGCPPRGRYPDPGRGAATGPGCRPPAQAPTSRAGRHHAAQSAPKSRAAPASAACDSCQRATVQRVPARLTRLTKRRLKRGRPRRRAWHRPSLGTAPATQARLRLRPAGPGCHRVGRQHPASLGEPGMRPAPGAQRRVELFSSRRM